MVVNISMLRLEATVAELVKGYGGAWVRFKSPQRRRGTEPAVRNA